MAIDPETGLPILEMNANLTKDQVMNMIMAHFPKGVERVRIVSLANIMGFDMREEGEVSVGAWALPLLERVVGKLIELEGRIAQLEEEKEGAKH